MKEYMYNIGKIVNTQGIRGELKVVRMTDFDDRFEVGNTVYAVSSDDSILELKIEGHRIHKGFDIVHFSGYDDINDVEYLKGSLLKIKASQLTDLDEGEYYYHEIVGCVVWTTDGQRIGTVKEILSPGANDVWVIKPEKGKDILIPYIDDVVKHVDVASQQIKIELMEGLLD